MSLKGEFTMNLKEYLIQEHKKFNLVAKYLGCSSVHLHMIMKGERFPSPKLAKKIQEYTGGTILWTEIIKQ